MARYLDKDYAIAYNDVLKALSATTQATQLQAIVNIRQQLQVYGYAEWLVEEA